MTLNLDDAIRAAAEEHSPGQPVMAYAVLIATLEPDTGDPAAHDLTVLGSPGQPAYATAGLIALAAQQVGKA